MGKVNIMQCQTLLHTLPPLIPPPIHARCDEEQVEDEVKARSATGDAMGAKTLNIPFDQPPLPEGTKCFVSGKPAKNWALFGRSY